MRYTSVTPAEREEPRPRHHKSHRRERQPKLIVINGVGLRGEQVLIPTTGGLALERERRVA